MLIPISQTTIGFLKDSIYVLLSCPLPNKILVQLRGGNINNWLNNSSALMQSYFRFVMKRADGVIVLGNKLKYLFKDYFEDDKIFVVPNGANFSFKLNKEINEKVYILYLSNLQPSKGIEDVIQSIEWLDKIVRGKIIFEVVGEWLDEKTKQSCLNFVNQSKLPVNFYPPAYNSEKWRYYNNADIFIFTPREPEGHPWVIIEAMAAGLPIISTDQGAITESVLDNVNGFIVEPQNPKQIADKLQLLIENKEQREKMGKESRKLYEANFTEESMISRLESVFDKILYT